MNLFFLLALVGVGYLLFSGEKDPAVNISESGVQIKGMYGLTVDFDEITRVSLIEKSMSELGVGLRTNGYGGLGGALKGHFSSASIGKALLFVCAGSSPTIKIERADKKDIYISLNDGEATEALSLELKAALLRIKRKTLKKGE